MAFLAAASLSASLDAFAFSFLAYFFARLPPFFFTTFFTTFFFFACASFHFSIFIFAWAALYSLLPFLYLDTLLVNAAIAFLAAASLSASLDAFAFSFLAYFFARLPPFFFTTFFTTFFLRLACASFHFSIFIFAC